MIEQELPDVFGSTVFCDDIRQEVSGKLIYVGAYPQRVMLVHGTFPTILPRFCFSISINQKTSLFSPIVGVRIFVPGDSDDAPSIEAEVGESVDGATKEQLDIRAQSSGLPESERNYVQIFSNMQFDNFQIKEAGQLKVRADIGGKRYKIGSLRIIASPKPS